MSLNHKRRIFRPAIAPLRGAALPSRGWALALAGGVLTALAGVWMALEPSQAPARPPSEGYVAADTSRVAVLDGGTLRVGDRVVRLAGLDPPARGEACHGLDGAGFDCGVAAANALAALVRDGSVACTLRGHDPVGHPLGHCVSQGAALNLALVAAGWARADRTQSDLSRAEDAARAGRRGLWAVR